MNRHSRRYRPAPPSTTAPKPAFTQAELRDRRRKHMPIVLGGDFNLAAEVAAICEPLAGRVAALPRPLSARTWVEELADAVHELSSTVVGWLAEADGYTRTRHLAADAAKRQNAIRLVVDLTRRPELPVIRDDDLAAGSWTATLVAMAEPVSGPLAELLARSHAPDAEILRGAPSRSERLERLLRETLDRAALSLQRYLERREHDRDNAPCRSPAAPKSADEIRAELQGMGVTL